MLGKEQIGTFKEKSRLLQERATLETSFVHHIKSSHRESIEKGSLRQAPRASIISCGRERGPAVPRALLPLVQPVTWLAGRARSALAPRVWNRDG